MSGKVTGLVWDVKGLPQSMKYVLLAYADHAEHDGGGIRPALETIADKVEITVRSVQRITRKLEAEGYLVPEGNQGGGRGVTRRWRIPIENNQVAPQKGDSGVTLSDSKKGDIPEQKGDSGVTLSGKRVTFEPLKGDSQVSPELLRATINTAEEEDARARPEIFKVFEAEIGPITPHIAAALKALEADHPPEWIAAAMRDASARGKRSLKYVQAILKRWAVEGYGTAPPWERGSDGQIPTGSRSKQNQSEPAGYEALRRYAEKHGIGEQHDGK